MPPQVETAPATAPTRPSKWPKRATFAVAMVPLARIVFLFFTNRLGANPIAEALNKLGFWTLILLLATLLCTPLKILVGWKWPLKVRKMLGLCAFFYACLHLGMYVGVDQFFDWGEIYRDIIKRPFITAGLFTFALLLPLAITSPNRMVQLMGFVRWKRLHRLVYLAGAAGVVHFKWRVKGDQIEPLVYGGVLAVLLLIRLGDFLRHRKARAA